MCPNKTAESKLIHFDKLQAINDTSLFIGFTVVAYPIFCATVGGSTITVIQTRFYGLIILSELLPEINPGLHC